MAFYRYSYSITLVKVFIGKSKENRNEDEEKSETVSYNFLLKAIVGIFLNRLICKGICCVKCQEKKKTTQIPLGECVTFSKKILRWDDLSSLWSENCKKTSTSKPHC